MGKTERKIVTMKILIAGGGGFLGIKLAERLAAMKHKVIIYDLRLFQPIRHKMITFIRGDIRLLHNIINLCGGVDVIFNLASLLPCSRAGNLFTKVNVDGNDNLLAAAQKQKVKKFIYVSTSIVYGIPSNTPCREDSIPVPIGPYGKSKVLAEQRCLEAMKTGLKVTILRPRFIVGPGRLGLLGILFDWIQRGKNVYVIGKGANRFQMVGVFDLIDACILAIKKGDNEIINIGADDTPSVYELLQGVITHAGSPSRIIRLPAGLARVALKLLDVFALTPFNAEHYYIADKEYLLDTAKAKKILGWKPKYSHQQMMNSAYDWFVASKDQVYEQIESDKPKEGLLKMIKFFS